MAQVKERGQAPAVLDTLRLRINIYNSNNRADPLELQKVELFFLDKDEITEANPLGLRIVKTIESPDIIREDCGLFSVTFLVNECDFNIGRYCDVWTIKVKENQPISVIEQRFEIFSDLWYTSPIPIIYDFKFNFRPNKLRQGSKRFLTIGIEPNVPTKGDLAKYYENLAIVSPLKIFIEQACVNCMPVEQDLRLIVDCDPVDVRERGRGFYFLDTEELDMSCGVYNVWFQMEFGESLYISDKQQLQIF